MAKAKAQAKAKYPDGAFGYICITDGVLRAEVKLQSGLASRYTRVWSGEANRQGALALGKWILENAANVNWYYSSSVDFPTESGGTRADFRTLIEKARADEAARRTERSLRLTATREKKDKCRARRDHRG